MNESGLPCQSGEEISFSSRGSRPLDNWILTLNAAADEPIMRARPPNELFFFLVFPHKSSAMWIGKNPMASKKRPFQVLRPFPCASVASCRFDRLETLLE